jgi:glycosyltransferase involved in cell wall biosynthesis
MKKITVLIPCYNEELSLPLLYDRLGEIMNTNSDYEWEILFINDGSKDNTINIIKSLRVQDKRICFIDLSRNFGKENAMLAGFDYATGDCMIIMDADLQDPPELIPQMLKYWEDGFEDVYARRVNRGKESWVRKKLSLAYYALLQRASRVDILQNVGDYRLLDRKCIDTLKQLRETQRYTKGMFCWIGFKKKEIDFDRGDRLNGKSSFNMLKLVGLAIEGITSFTVAPLRISTILGFSISMFSFIYLCYFLVKTLIFKDPVQGFPTLIIVILFLGGVQLLSLGIIGEYLGRVFYETKNRPVYIVSEHEGV